MNEKLKELGFSQNTNKRMLEHGSGQVSDDDDNGKGSVPIDYEFAVGMIENGIVEPQLNLPEAKDTLYVTKPIDKYEPAKPTKLIDGKLKQFNPDPNTTNKKKFPVEPKTHSEIRDTTMELSPEMLQKIEAGPVRIDFTNVYIKSKMSKTFYVKNDLRTSISVRLYTDKDELSLSYLKPQIIPSGQVGGFDVVICSKGLGQVKQNIKYIINERHIFELMVTAQIDPVALELSKQSIKFTFAEDNIELETNETLKLTNHGNAPAKFKWMHTERKIFTVVPEEGEVAAGETKDLKVWYRPTQTANIQINTNQGNN